MEVPAECLTARCFPFSSIRMYLELLFIVNVFADGPLFFMGPWMASREKETPIPPEALQPRTEYEWP